MRCTISRWGNSLGVRLPKALLAEARLGVGATLTVEATADGALILRPTHRSRLEDLIAGIAPENLHGESFDEAPVGNEVW